MSWRTSWKGKNSFAPRSSPNRPVKIAIVLHIFYEDYVDKFCSLISRIDFPVDVFVTTTNTEIAHAAESKLSRTQNVNKVKVALVPNKGRNFAPLFVEFGQELLKYDIFGHFHSKKSLFSGKEQTEWADYLFNVLLDPARCKQHINLLADQTSNVGLIYPTTPPAVPFFGNHWLQNVNAGRMLEIITGQKVSQFGFITYPLGGMFWARSLALASLLGANWSYDQFPEEHGQIDGTLQHGIERFVSVACEVSGYKKVAFHPELNTAFEDDSYVFAGYLDSLEIFHSGYLVEVDCLSVNLFETVISRANSFDDFQKVKASQLLGFADPSTYLEFRNGTELEVRNSLNSGDVSITQVAELMSQKIQNLQSSALSPAEIIEAELNCELDIARPKSMLASVIKKRQSSGKQTTVVTDTYYEREHVERILTKAGIALEFLDLQVSSETGLRKDNSSYWAVLAESMKDFEGSYLHVGDNLVADVQLPSDFGFRTFYLPNARDLAWMLGSDIPNDISVIADEFVQRHLNLYQDPIFTASGVPISSSTIY
jgi:FMN phosphatase YigB (HAD superfamily)